MVTIVSPAGGMIYLVNTVTLERLSIQFIPMELSYSSDADLSDVKIIGRNEPKFQYTGGKTTMPMEFEFYSIENSRQDVVRAVKWLETLRMSDGYDRQPPKVKIVFGNFFRDEIWTVKSVQPKFSLFNRFYGMMPQQAAVKVEFVLDPPTNRTWKDVFWSSEVDDRAFDTINRSQSDIA